METLASYGRFVREACTVLLRTRPGFFGLWVAGTVAILAAVAISGDMGLLALIVDRELLVLVVETAALYGIYLWRMGVLASTGAMVRQRAWRWAASVHLCTVRWSS